MTQPVEAPTGTFSIWKPIDSEFEMAVEFAAIANALNSSVSSVVFTLVDTTANGQDGHTLSGHL